MRDDAPSPSSIPAPRRIAVSIHAMGGQGGGVLAEWITHLAECQGYVAQMTSVPGVAQRTGATVYYVEMIPRGAGNAAPVLALMPAPGDVDLVIAAELMEAGRAIQRGFVTPDRTTLIASTHRSLAVSEKEVPGDGAADASKVYAALGVAAKRSILADFAQIADSHSSIISAALFGAVHASGVLPFPRMAFEQAIREGGTGVEASLAAFAAAIETASRPASAGAPKAGVAEALPALPASAGHPALDALLQRVRTQFPVATHGMIYLGVRHLADFQDPAYAAEYLDRLQPVLALDAKAPHQLTTETARHLARAMAYDDVIRVADLKIRGSRRARISAEVAVKPGADVLQTLEFFHPRMEEVCGTLPAWLGGAIERRPALMHALDRIVNRGRRVRTDTILGHLQLAAVASRRKHRRATLRHGRETAHCAAWLARILDMGKRDISAAIEIAKSRRLVKGYSDTMARGLSKFDRVMAGAKMVEGRADAADWIRRLRQAAMLDEDGLALDGALRTLATLDDAARATRHDVVKEKAR